MIGSGGKTSLLFRLAEENRAARRVLIAPTTKMLRPGRGEYDWDISLCRGEPRSPAADGRGQQKEGGRAQFAPAEGIYLLHSGAPGEKITAPPMARLAAACAEADLALLECDGSRGLPLKGWAAYEPLVPSFVSVTVGVLPLWALGQPVGPMTVHRVEEFCQLTGALPDEPVSFAHMAAVIEHAEGLFQRAHGRRVLFLNSRQEDTPPERAASLTEALDPAVRQSLTVLAGDIHRGTVWRILP